jgi:hypothetical protein
MAENNSLVKPLKPPMGGLKKGIALNRQTYEQKMKEIDPTTVPNRLGLVFDDSGSMMGQAINDAHTAVKGFTASCNPLDTSITVYPLNLAPKPLTCDYDMLNLYVNGIEATGGTPIYGVLDNLISMEKITRTVLFSDGEPTDSTCLKEEKETNDDFYYGRKDPKKALEVITKYQQKEIPIDTIFIGQEASKGYREMETLAKLTNGIFIHFKDSSSLSKNLKYLSPAKRFLLANAEMKKRIEAGEAI